jgi:8-oxo-dGTP pyrophosphatase MutT (NUDIX family)
MGANMSLIDRGFAIAYRLARVARDIYWDVRRPVLLGVRTIVSRDGQLLLVRHRAGPHSWSLPGGGVDRHERFVEAARREVYEEAGVVAQGGQVLGVYEVFRGNYPNYIVVYVMEASDAPRPPRSIEIADAQFFDADRLPPDLEPASARRIAEYRSGERGITALW